MVKIWKHLLLYLDIDRLDKIVDILDYIGSD